MKDKHLQSAPCMPPLGAGELYARGNMASSPKPCAPETEIVLGRALRQTYDGDLGDDLNRES